MKTKMKLFFTAIIVLSFTSCMTSSYYQAYSVAPSSIMVTNENNLIYEDENCTVSYNLWGNKGNIGFGFYNKTNQDIFLNLDKCFFILNGIASDYYKNRIFTNSASSGAITSSVVSASKSVSGVNIFDLFQTNKIQSTKGIDFTSTSGRSISYNEEKIVCVPSKTSKIIAEFNINETIYRDCDLLRYPSKRQIKTITFTKDNSPLVFSNRITYNIGKSEVPVKFENEFFVANITNYSEKDFTTSKKEVICGQETLDSKKYFKYSSPNKFYIQYEKGSNEVDY